MLFGSSNYVTCEKCGELFNIDWGGYYYKHTQRFICKRCYKRMKRDEKNPSWLDRNWKAIVGGLIVFSVIYNIFSDEEPSEPSLLIMTLLIGIILLVSHFRSKKKK